MEEIIEFAKGIQRDLDDGQPLDNSRARVLMEIIIGIANELNRHKSQLDEMRNAAIRMRAAELD